MTTKYKTMEQFVRKLVKYIPPYGGSDEKFLVSLNMGFDEIDDMKVLHPGNTLFHGIMTIVKSKGITMGKMQDVCKDLKCVNAAELLSEHSTNVHLQRQFDPQGLAEARKQALETAAKRRAVNDMAMEMIKESDLDPRVVGYIGCAIAPPNADHEMVKKALEANDVVYTPEIEGLVKAFLDAK